MNTQLKCGIPFSPEVKENHKKKGKIMKLACKKIELESTILNEVT